MLPDRLSQQPLHPSQALLEVRFLEHPKLQVASEGPVPPRSGVKFARVDVGDSRAIASRIPSSWRLKTWTGEDELS